MHLVEIYLPVRDGIGQAFEPSQFADLRADLTERFGGVTAFTRAPAQGVTLEHGQTVHDDIIILEVMVEDFDRAWWKKLKSELEQRFAQVEILIRASEVEKL